MHLIPVIDVRYGVAVRAVAGQRAEYRPLETPLATGNDPAAVAHGLLALFPFEALYVADLDGIEGRGANPNLVVSLRLAAPSIELWVDDGSVGQTAPSDGIIRVLGSESLTSSRPSSRRRPEPTTRPKNTSRSVERSLKQPSDLLLRRVVGPGLRRDDGAVRGAAAANKGGGIVLSLDFRGDEFIGQPELLEDTSLWPERVIVMTLARVGVNAGPDLMKIREVANRAGSWRAAYAAGGIRHLDDLKAVHGAGARGALVASALHSGALSRRNLEDASGL